MGPRGKALGILPSDVIEVVLMGPGVSSLKWELLSAVCVPLISFLSL
jgi:hypothetical protein